ncbi:uncharacterized protein C2845_PM08G08130 [Panicum miliaceum]|uniref:Uncharacterized protein n=1 Tax=Panicum miliaceum TaxID=4540 RepID=A0A3L6QWP4_PANMI|nr:uncharacterized protein C2845_PM08G08130 [Panicum miliaceum]
MAARAAAAACDAVRGALRGAASRLRSCHSSISASSSPGALAAGLAALLCCGAAAAAFPRAAASLLPLAASTALCCAAAGLYAAEERSAADAAVEAVVLVGGRRRQGKPEAGLVQVIGEANASAYADNGGGVQVGCFLRRSAWRGVDEDGEEVVFAGTLAPCLAGGVPRLGHGALEEEVAAMRVDRLAEGVWDSYFGGWSRWHDVDAAA